MTPTNYYLAAFTKNRIHLQPIQQCIFATIQLQSEEMNAKHVELQNRQNRVVCIKDNV